MRQSIRALLLAVMCGSLSFSLPATAIAKNDKAQGNGKPAHAAQPFNKNSQANGNSGDRRDDGNGALVGAAAGGILTGLLLSDQEVRIIRDWYGAHSVQPASLPPGIAKNLRRGKPLPPGIAKKLAPQPLVSRLDIPYGYQLVEVGTDVLLIEAGTRIIAEILKDAIRG